MLRSMTIWGFLVVLSTTTFAADEGTETFDTELYYQSHEIPKQAGSIELRPNFGFDFSDPYLHLYSGGLGVFYQIHPLFLVGGEFAFYTSTHRRSFDDLSNELGGYGFTLAAPAPEWTSVAVIRFVPFSNLTNFFSKEVIVTNLSLGIRGGVTHYAEISAPTGGFLFDVTFGLTQTLGFAVGMNWDLEKINDNPLKSRVGFRMGPTLTF